MCGRFALTATTKEIEKLKPGLKIKYDYKPNPNFSPTMMIPIIKNTNVDEMEPAVWGLIPSWAKDSSFSNKLFNARAESLEEKPSFRNNFKSKRCIIPASCYFEWKNIEGSKKKQKFIIKSSNNDLLFFAGLWDIWVDNHGKQIQSTTIITCEPNLDLSDIHNRMPVILKTQAQDIWLAPNIDSQELKCLLIPYSECLLINEVIE